MHFRVLFSLVLVFWSASVRGFGGADDRYIKKYAMMKVYESCLGPDVVKEVRQEMKAACAKCAGVSATAPGQALHPPPSDPLGVPVPPMTDKRKPPVGAVPPTFDPTRLQQAILGFRNPAQQNPLLSGYIQQTPASPHYRPVQAPAGFYPQQYPLYYPAAPSNPVYSHSVPYHSVYPGMSNPFYPAAPFYSAAPTYSSGQRSSRDLDIRGQLETLTSRLSGKIRNVTCVMQELGYLDENLEPNFEKISERINRLPIGDELKKDMIDGVQFCKQFAQCVPETRKDRFQLSRELVKPMFFFRCYKHKKLEACIMKDVRERYTPGDDMPGADDDNIGSGELRSLSWTNSKPDNEDMATAVYEFLYGGENAELENIM
ncbi:uncharacterized protein [Periplaneta americana]|uniref:uncharacterized protein isoform X2 n=1 Tax=Periplaneta americana TaxID=6978 RepID=UPI0037E9C1B9